MPLLRLWPLPVTLVLLAVGAPVRAGSITAESVWSRDNALQRATEQVPAGATVTGSSCQEVNVRMGNYRYICTVEFSTAPQAAPSPAPAAP